MRHQVFVICTAKCPLASLKGSDGSSEALERCVRSMALYLPDCLSGTVIFSGEFSLSQVVTGTCQGYLDPGEVDNG